ncbi:MAG: hypothetical protein AAGC73_02920 [Verrucomicrobiota bacterium]
MPIIGIDLGYSTSAPSCGLALSDRSKTCALTFGESIKFVTQHLLKEGPHNLIIEAVLSTYHNAEGNPAIRGDFEKGRGWYHGPGVSTFAAALRFLSELDQRLSFATDSIPVAEGFLSYKSTRTAHTEDADRLVREFDSAERFLATSGSQPICELIDGVPEILRYNQPGQHR